MFEWPAIDRSALRDAKMTRIEGFMQKRKLDHLLVTGFDTIRYAADYRTLIIAEAFDWFAALVGREGQSDVFVPWVDETQEDPEPESPWILAVHPLPSWAPALAHVAFWASSIGATLRQRGARRVGVELIYVELLEALRVAAPDVDFVPVSAELYDLRLVKDPLELELLTASSAVNSRAAEAAMVSASAGMTDHEVLAVAMASLQRDGAEFVSHSVCNVRRGTGAWFAIGNELRGGDAFFFDIGCYGVGGYASDMARTAFVGEPPGPVLLAYGHLLEALRIGEEAARPGIHASAVHDAVNDYLERNGLPVTPYSVGHGVGLRACELPTIHRRDRMDCDQRLAEGMVIALEPETGVELDGRFVLLKVEDNYVVGSEGLRRLTDAAYAPGLQA